MTLNKINKTTNDDNISDKVRPNNTHSPSASLIPTLLPRSQRVQLVAVRIIDPNTTMKESTIQKVNRGRRTICL
jgi:hypothetical protein